MDEETKPKSKAAKDPYWLATSADETKPKREAKDNPWYRLSTLHGEPKDGGDERAAKNRETWNRWMVPRLSDKSKTALRAMGWSERELTPFSEAEQQAIAAQLGLPLEADRIDFSDTWFAENFCADSFVFPCTVDFDDAAFSGRADFKRAVFVEHAGFESTVFHGVSNFGSVFFGLYAYFGRAVFDASAVFESTVFRDHADFRGADFRSYASFNGADFRRRADFARAVFNEQTDFEGAAFRGFANFQGITFHGDTGFVEAVFSSVADFKSAAFSRDVLFGSVAFYDHANFVNTEMKGETDFTRVKFARPPKFFGAKLHEGTTWLGVIWPVAPKGRAQAAQYVKAYERLKLEMDRLKKHSDELDFFALEQQCRRVADGFWKGLPIAIYGFVSDYGRSYIRPLALLVASVLVGTIIFAAHEAGFWTPLLGYVSKAAGVSFANTLSLLGRPLLNPDVTLYKYPDWLKAVATIQTILGIAFLFLFGLGIRNRFRMK